MTAAQLIGGSQYPTPSVTLAHLLIDAAGRAPTTEALVCDEYRLTYAKYLRRVCGFALHLQRQKLSGQRVALLLGNSIEMAVASFAVHMAGAQAVLLNPAYTARELGVILADAEPSLLVHHRSLGQLVASIADWQGPTFVVEGGSFDSFAASPADIVLPGPDDLATLQYTGGTTGRPKGVNLTHRALATNVAQREALLPTQHKGERILCVTPLFHSYATAMALHLSAFCNGTLIILPKYSAEATLNAISLERVTVFPGSPTIFVGLMANPKFATTDFSSVRLCYSGSAALPAETLARWEKAVGCKVYEGYGQTEAGPVLTYNSPIAGAKAGSVGVPLPATTIEIVDLDNGDRILETGQNGEIRAKGPQLMSGYRNAATELKQRCGTDGSILAISVQSRAMAH